MSEPALRFGVARLRRLGRPGARRTTKEAFVMNKFKLALAGLAAVGGALVAAPEPAQAGGFGFSVGFGHPGYYGHGYYPASYGWGHPVYYRPRRVVYGYPYHYRRPFARRGVVYPAPPHPRPPPGPPFHP